MVADVVAELPPVEESDRLPRPEREEEAAEKAARRDAREAERDLHGRLVSARRRVKGSYSLLIMSADQMIAVRDPHGFRPLVLGRLQHAKPLVK